MYNEEKTINNNEINNTNEDIIINEEEICEINSEKGYKTPLIHLQLIFCTLTILIILFNKYVFNNQSLNQTIVREITHETTEDEIKDFINSILDIKNP